MIVSPLVLQLVVSSSSSSSTAELRFRALAPLRPPRGRASFKRQDEREKSRCRFFLVLFFSLVFSFPSLVFSGRLVAVLLEWEAAAEPFSVTFFSASRA